MSTETDTRDRVMALEVKVQHCTDTIEQLNRKVDEIHDILTQARGAQKAIRLLIWLSGTSVFIWGVSYWKAITAFLKG